MENSPSKFLHYKRSHFATQLPIDCLYSPSHLWLAQMEDGLWRAGFTKFATRMLGEIVDCGFETPPNSPVASGQIIGWIEGFKAISDIYCALAGSFAGANPVLKSNIAVVGSDPYRAGWLYEVRGEPDAKCVDVHGYKAILDVTIGRILEKQQTNEGQ